MGTEAPAAVHPDLFSPFDAARFLRLDETCPSSAAAVAAVQRLARRAGVTPLVWGKAQTWHRSHLEAIVAHELARQSSVVVAPQEVAR